MNNKPLKKPHVVFYFSDTGGGHRSAAEAIIEAVHLEYGKKVTTEMVDFIKDYAPVPFKYGIEMYPYMVISPQLWRATFHATDGRAQARFIKAAAWPLVRPAAHALVRIHPADIIVSVHAFANTFAPQVHGNNHLPLITVVTDMVTPHALWFDKRSDIIFVSTETARERGIKYGMLEEKMRVVGMPVANRYRKTLANKRALRKKLGWPVDQPVVLFVGGGDGIGPLGKAAVSVDESDLDISLIVVTGRNKRLKATLESRQWQKPTIVYGFTRDMPNFMRAADFIVTKAGPSTIAEALNAHLPIILYSKLPGQEDGNVTFVVDEGAGVWAPKPVEVVRALTRWISHPKEREAVIENCRRVALPDAARNIARAIGEQLGLV